MENTPTKPYQFLSGNGLKLIAITTMFLDHIGAAILENPALYDKLGASSLEVDVFFNDPRLTWLLVVDLILRAIGRIAFPIFCFLLVEGFLHTRDLRRYAGRMLFFAVITEVPFDLAFSGSWFAPGYQNVYFTLFLGLLAMTVLRRFGDRSPLGFLLALGCAGVAELARVDYGGGVRGHLLGTHRSPGLPAHRRLQRPTGEVEREVFLLSLLPRPHPAALPAAAGAAGVMTGGVEKFLRETERD